jgi:hypothetical protein
MSYKRTLQLSSEHAPGFAYFKGHYFLAWVDEQSGLNVWGLEDTIEQIINPSASSRTVHIPAEEPRLFRSGLENESSHSRPALAAFKDRLVLAWTGTDGGSHLNVISSADGRKWDQDTKRILGELSMAGPALAVYNDRLHIAWTGVDGTGHLSVMSSADALTFDRKDVIPNEHSIDAPPSLAVGQTLTSPVQRFLYIGWTERGTNKVKMGACEWDAQGNFTFDLGGFVFSHGHPDDIHSSAPPSLSGGFGITAAWIGEGNHFFMSGSDLGDPGLGSSWNDPIEFADSSDEPPTIIPGDGSMTNVGFAWKGLDGKHHLNISQSSEMPVV